MKVVIVVALLVAVAQASVLSNIAERLIPSFATGYVINGTDAVAHAAPYIVSLASNANASHSCGGTIIAKDWIITAAHCISKAVGMKAIAGLHTRANLDARTQTRIVDFGKVHENYSGGVGPYDIAILHVSKSFIFNQWIQPAILPSKEEIHSGETHLYGWGQPKPFVFTPARTLQTVQTEIVEWERCKEILPETAPFHATNLCSDSLERSISACNGDSGGPLVVENKNASSELIGIVSWGYIPCGVMNLPSIYTRVSAYVDWIAKIQHAYYVLF